MPLLEDASLAAANAAHLFAVIEAFCTDRVEDGQVPATPALVTLIGHLREECERHLGRIQPGSSDTVAGYRLAQQSAQRASRTERLILHCGASSDLALYEALSLAKQEVAFGPSVALARAAGWSNREASGVRQCLASVALGLQVIDDLFDWEDDLAHGGAWAVSLALGAHRSNDTIALGAHLAGRRVLVLRSGVLAVMADRAAHHFHAARRRASALGALRLAAWADEQQRGARGLAQAERSAPGATLRKRALRAWAAEVLG